MKSVLKLILIFSVLVACNQNRGNNMQDHITTGLLDPESRLQELGLELPEPYTPFANYVGAMLVRPWVWRLCRWD